MPHVATVTWNVLTLFLFWSLSLHVVTKLQHERKSTRLFHWVSLLLRWKEVQPISVLATPTTIWLNMPLLQELLIIWHTLTRGNILRSCLQEYLISSSISFPLPPWVWEPQIHHLDSHLHHCHQKQPGNTTTKTCIPANIMYSTYQPHFSRN